MASASSLDTTTSRQFVRSGLGGAGNYHFASSITPTTPLLPLPTSQSSTFTSGIGGAGNSHPTAALPSLSAADALKRDHLRRDHSPDTWHHGIGGAGNFTSRSSSSSASRSTESTASSSSSSSSRFDKLKSRLAAHIATRNSLFEAWQCKLPTNSPTAAPVVAVREKNYPACKSVSSSSSVASSTGADSITARLGGLMDRAVWRLDRITTFGVAEGMRAAVPVYAKLDM